MPDTTIAAAPAASPNNPPTAGAGRLPGATPGILPASPREPGAALVWLRRDLRAIDHAPLAQALSAHPQVWCAFVFDTDILGSLADRADRRVAFIHASLVELDVTLRNAGGGLIVRHGPGATSIVALARELGVSTVYAGRDYEPEAVARDAQTEAALAAEGRRFVTIKDQVVFERDEVLTGSNTPFSVFTPYRRAWEKRLAAQPEAIAEHRVAPAGRLAPPPGDAAIPTLEALGFEPVDLPALRIRTGASGAAALLEDFRRRIGGYGHDRDFPALKGPSYLSVHLRFGTVSVRSLMRAARDAVQQDPRAAAGAAVWQSELTWRDFYFQILHHHPRVTHRAFRPEYDAIAWEQGETADRLLTAWCEARTGYPLVDAAMRQLAQTGYMHNRLRMVTASFLVKDLGLDWRLGEAHFARQLIDFDLAANNGGWQWAASTGCDAQPWFRIFNPVTQSQKFDPQGRFIRRYLPELARLPDRAIHAPWLAGPLDLMEAGVRLGETYPRPVVDHDHARQRTLARFGAIKGAAAAGEV